MPCHLQSIWNLCLILLHDRSSQQEDILRYECDQKFIDLKEYITKYYLNQNSERNTHHPLDLLKPFLRFWYLDSDIVELLIRINNKEILYSNISDLVKRLIDKVDIRNGET